MISKRSKSQTCKSTPIKKFKLSVSNNYFHAILRENGLILKAPPEKCIASNETVHIIHQIKRSLRNHYDYPRNISDLFVDFEKECKDLVVFKHYLFPNIVRLSGAGNKEMQVKDSVIKILLSVPVLQNKLSEYVFEKAIDLAAKVKCGPWIQMILKCFSSLDTISNTDQMSRNLITLLDVCNEKIVKLEIITAIPDIIGDQEHDNIATEMSRILSEEHELIPAILDCLSYLCLSDEQYVQLQNKTLSLLMTLSKYNYFPNFVKFLLLPGRLGDNSYLDAVKGLRNALGWPSTEQPQERATSQVLTATAIRNSMISSKVVGNCWLKAISACKVHTDCKPIDLVILLISYSTSEEKQRQVENLVKKQIKLNILKEELIDETFKDFKPILKEYLKQLIDLSNNLLKTKADPTVQTFASHMYALMFEELGDCCPTLVAELLQLKLHSKNCVMNVLLILNEVAIKDISLLAPQSTQMLNLLDRMDDMTLDEVRAIMNLLCGVAYSYENSVIRDDVHMIIRKELGSSNPMIKVQGILAATHAIKYLMLEESGDDLNMSERVDYSSVNYLPEGDLREAGQIYELIKLSTKQFPDMTAFFYDELSKIISSASVVNKLFLIWLTINVREDFERQFLVSSIEDNKIGKLKISMQYSLNADSEVNVVKAVNIAALILKYNSEVSVNILSSFFYLVQVLHSNVHECKLRGIDALLGCPIVMPIFDINMVGLMDPTVITNILDCLVHCVNWFRELLNAFAPQNDEDLKIRNLKRLQQIEELQSLITEILLNSKIMYKPPACTFNINKYTGEQVSRRYITTNKGQNNKQKPTKKQVHHDTVLPETSKKQPTHNNTSVKSSLDISHNMPYRHLNLNLLNLIKTNLTDDKESDTELTVKTLNFLLKCVNSNVETILISKINRNTFLSKQKTVTYESAKAEQCAKSVSEILPKLGEHLVFVTSALDTLTNENEENEGDILFTSEMMNYVTCLENIYYLCTIYFKWIGFKSQQHNGLLKSSLRSIANPTTPTVSLKDLILNVAQFLHKHQKYCVQLSTAVSLIEFLKSIQNYSDNKTILNILRNLAEMFLSKQWKTPEGQLEKGLHFNQSIDRFASIYCMNIKVLVLKNLISQLTQEIKILKTRSDTLSYFKCFNKNNFSIFYRNLGTALYVATKYLLDKGMPNIEHLELWKNVTVALKNMSEIAKTLKSKKVKSVFFIRSMPILKLFKSRGIPKLELLLKNNTKEVFEILKILQPSTVFLQKLCNILKQHIVLITKVPRMKSLLESLLYNVKAALVANNCSEAFGIKNIQNKNIDREVIATQQYNE